MGADATVFVFDYDRYVDDVVPALRDLLRTGDAGGLLGALIGQPGENDLLAAYQADWAGTLLPYLRTHPTDLARHCTYLGGDLRYQGDQSRRGWGEETYSPCRSRVCPDRVNCLLHEGDREEIRELVTVLFEVAVATRCLGHSRFVGRTAYAMDFLPALDRSGVPADHPVRDLLAALELRGRVLGYGNGGSDGIHGWLTPDETSELAAGLPADLSLAPIRAAAGIAAGSGQGLLWGNDVIPGLWQN
jgi:hypothetical protein